jgi:hypothetical protein
MPDLTPSVYAAAVSYVESGLSVIPIRPDGSKAASVIWSPYQERLPTPQELKRWFKGTKAGIAALGGEVSGYLLILDFDELKAFRDWLALCKEVGLDEWVRECPLVETPNGGRHLYLRSTMPVRGNEKLAQRLVDGRPKTTIETRAEGGYCLAPPSPAECHPSGKQYRVLSGDFTQIPAIESGYVEALLAIAKSISEYVPPEQVYRGPPAQETPQERAGLQPGDDYNQRPDRVQKVSELLQKHGWTWFRKVGDSEHWCRPGMERRDHPSASLFDSGILYIFSSNAAPFEPGHGYNPFWVYTLLEHNGDYKAAARELGRQGYGEAPRAIYIEPPPEEWEPPDLNVTPLVSSQQAEEIPPPAEGLLDSPPDTVFSEDQYPAFPYYRDRGQMVLLKLTGGGDTRKAEPVPIADFVAEVTEDAVTEDGGHIWTIEGKTNRNRKFRTEIDARQFTDARMLKSSLAGGAGPLAPVKANMEKHLGPAIQRLTAAFGSVKELRLYERTGWIDESCSRFLLPGYQPDDTTRIVLPNNLPYQIHEDASLDKGLECLKLLMQAKPLRLTTVLLSAILGPVMARMAGLDNDRYGLFASGGTGSFKTTFTTMMMSIFGREFIKDVILVKWGEGATSNALLHLGTYATDLPYLIDNYKPGTGGGEKAFVGLMHNLLEGGERARMNKNSKMRHTREIHCWPICTGEDTPGNDAATLARLLVLPFEREGTDQGRLTKAQALSENLPAIGKCWLDWLQTEDGKKAVQEAASLFPDQRVTWHEIMIAAQPDSFPHARTAANLAVNDLVGLVISQHPILSQVWSITDHNLGLRAIAGAMATGTAESSEAHRFLSILSELFLTGSILCAPRGAVLADFAVMTPGSYNSQHEPDRLVGWKDDKGYYLLPELARRAVERVRPGVLNELSKIALSKQLDAMGAIVGHDNKTLTKKIKDSSGATHNVLWLRLNLLTGDNAIPDTEDGS